MNDAGAQRGDKAGGLQRPDIVMSGWLRKKNTAGVPKLKLWKNRFFVLDRRTREIRYYKKTVESGFGTVPVDEAGSVPLELVTALQSQGSGKYAGTRFDIHMMRFGRAKYSREFAGDGHKGLVEAGFRLCLQAPSAADREAWLDAISPLIQGQAAMGTEALRRSDRGADVGVARTGDDDAPRGRGVHRGRGPGRLDDDDEGGYDDGDGDDDDDVLPVTTLEDGRRGDYKRAGGRRRAPDTTARRR
jgi:hypothetical protein